MCSLPHFKNFQVNFEVFAQHDKLSNTIDLHLPNNFDKAARSAPKARLYVYFSCFNSGKFSTNKVNCEQLTHALEIQCELQTIYTEFSHYWLDQFIKSDRGRSHTFIVPVGINWCYVTGFLYLDLLQKVNAAAYSLWLCSSILNIMESRIYGREGEVLSLCTIFLE